MLDKKFDQKTQHNVSIQNLTHVQVNGKENDICLIIDLFNREIIEYSMVVQKTFR
ncbi:MAG: hypothetical protein ACRCVW_06170 [Brevinema sp.]